jgi:Ca2+-binding EF-hand superfamily protein
MPTERHRSTRSRGLLLAVALGLIGPVGHAQYNPEDATDDDSGTVLDFLQEKYDADGDGQVSRAEYDRGDEAFARLDKNEDGALDESDFAESSRGPGGRMTPDMVAPMILMRYFDDDENEGLTREELERSIAAYDRDDDDRVSRKEFEGALEERDDAGGGMMGMQMNRYSMLLGVADQNDDLHVSNEELLAWFDERDTDHDGIWSQGGGRGGRGPRGAGREAEAVPEDPSPSAMGKIAPDFDLEPPHGGKPVKLSDFKGEKPVALIFGSYT